MSKGLEALNSLFETMPFAFLESNTMKELKIIEKELKALEIIKNTLPAFVYAITDSKDYQDYSTHYISPIITKEEYDLLKEVLNA